MKSYWTGYVYGLVAGFASLAMLPASALPLGVLL